MRTDILFADIGNTHFHICEGEKIEHLLPQEAIKKYHKRKLYYICVNSAIDEQIAYNPLWENIAPLLSLKGFYATMGVDRKALCLSHPNGLFVDAGSAITVDVVEAKEYQGGFILAGLKATTRSYTSISPVLDVSLDKMIDLSHLPRTTKEQISYGIIAPIKALIDQHHQGRMLYFTGGDGKFLASFFEGAIYDEKLVFEGMKKAIMYKG